jgi:hypothetical protein
MFCGNPAIFFILNAIGIIAKIKITVPLEKTNLKIEV